MIVAH